MPEILPESIKPFTLRFRKPPNKADERKPNMIISAWHWFPIPFCGLVGFLGGASSKKSTWQCRRSRLDPWVRKIPRRRKWQPTPVFLPGKFYGQRSLVGYSPWGRKDLEWLKRLSMHEEWHRLAEQVLCPEQIPLIPLKIPFIQTLKWIFSSLLPSFIWSQIIETEEKCIYRWHFSKNLINEQTMPS